MHPSLKPPPTALQGDGSTWECFCSFLNMRALLFSIYQISSGKSSFHFNTFTTLHTFDFCLTWWIYLGLTVEGPKFSSCWFGFSGERKPKSHTTSISTWEKNQIDPWQKPHKLFEKHWQQFISLPLRSPLPFSHKSYRNSNLIRFQGSIVMGWKTIFKAQGASAS